MKDIKPLETDQTALKQKEPAKFVIEQELDEKGEPYSPPRLTIRGDKNALAEALGTEQEVLWTTLLGQISNADPRVRHDLDASVNANLASMLGLSPQNELEGMLCSQMVAVHNISMEVAKRSMLKDQTPEGLSENVNRANRMMRLFLAQVEALSKYRAKGTQTIQVQHVTVGEGGQAVIGNVNTKGGGKDG